jgi:hypothetical protein
MIDKKFIARHRLRFSLGLGIIGSFLTVINMLTFAKVWEETFKFYSIPMIIIYAVLPLGYIIVCWFIGYFYDVKGIWKEETSHSNANLNPEFLVLCENVVKLDEKLDDLNKRLDDLNKGDYNKIKS